MVVVKTLAFILPLALSYILFRGSSSPVPVSSEQDITTLSPTQIKAYKPFTWYASAAHCPADVTGSWTCGVSCEANPSFVPTASGGDGDGTQYWFVGYDPVYKSVIVGHQGTDFAKIKPILTILGLFLVKLDSKLFPEVGSSVKVHMGFRNEHAKTAKDILEAVQRTMTLHSATHVTLVGHSLGAALALLDAVYLPLHLPAGTTFSMYGYGTPRIGNEEFADYVDSHVTKLTRINNRKDAVPILPGRLLGYHQPYGEVHIINDLSWVACSGDDNTSPECSTGAVPNIFKGNGSNHEGPYDGIILGIGCDH